MSSNNHQDASVAVKRNMTYENLKTNLGISHKLQNNLLYN